MSDFDHAFKAIVVPRLKVRARIVAVSVHLGETTFSDAVEDVWSDARRLGADYLDGARSTDLRDWIMAQILAGVDEAERISARLAAERQRDPANYYRQLVVAAPGAKGACMAISPEYREVLRG